MRSPVENTEISSMGIVIIGRNEGERFRRCLASIVPGGHFVVYVDSGSSDGSVAWARQQDVAVVELDMTRPFTAARARNEGCALLHQLRPDLAFVQFVDGDCELCAGWLTTAEEYLMQHDRCGAVAGQTIEKYPERSLYNRLCALEWKTSPGRVESCGGIFMMRMELFLRLGGFNPQLVAGEEPELCYRLRQLGWEVHRLDAPMALHDAAMTKFSQWWKRCVRGGLSYAQNCTLHGILRGRLGLKESLRIWFWAVVVPGCILLTVFIAGTWGLLLLAIYPVQGIRIAINVNKQFNNWEFSLKYSLFNLLGKFAQLYGQLQFFCKELFNKKHTIIEYK